VKKLILWCVAISAGAVSIIAGAILTVMYSRDIYFWTIDKVSKIKSSKDKALIQLLSKPYQTDDAK
jgi:hypothetical protein